MGKQHEVRSCDGRRFPAVLVLLAAILYAPGCGDDAASDDFEVFLSLQQDRPAEPVVTYEIRDALGDIVESGEMSLSEPPRLSPWTHLHSRREFETPLPVADGYRLILDVAPVAGFRCSGATGFSVPPRVLEVSLDCRSVPRPPDMVEAPRVYIVGDRQAE